MPDKVECNCRGRNGWFKFNEVDVCIGKEAAWVDIYSPKRGDSAPISFRMEGKHARWRLGKLFMAIGKFLLNGEKAQTVMRLKWEEYEEKREEVGK